MKETVNEKCCIFKVFEYIKQNISNTVKIWNIQTTERIAATILKFEQCSFTIVSHQKDADCLA